MLQNIKELYTSKLTATDGAIGHVQDFYFDDHTWVVRYLVADTGSWLAERRVLLSPHAFGKQDQFDNTLYIKLTKKQIEDSPPIEWHKPVSRQYEEEYYRYYGWPAYWEGSAVWGIGGFPSILPPPPGEPTSPSHHHRSDKHLQSARAINGYHLQAADGIIGHVSGLIVDNRSWLIHDVVVETGHWYAGREIPVPPSKITRISYEESKVFTTLTKADFTQAAENAPAKIPAGLHR